MEISDYVQRQIDEHVWLVGDVIPNETKLAEQFGVSRPTVRAALTRLEAKGQVRRIKGLGTIVQPTGKLDDATIFIEGWADNLRKHGKTIISKTISFETAPADDETAEKLRLPKGSDVFKILRFRYEEGRRDDGPQLLAYSYIPTKYDFFNAEYFQSDRAGLSELFERNHVFRAYIDKELKPVIMDDYMCDLLDEPPGSLAIEIDSLVWDNRENAIEFSRGYWSVTKNKFTLKVRL